MLNGGWFNPGLCKGMLNDAKWLNDGFWPDVLFREANWLKVGFWTGLVLSEGSGLDCFWLRLVLNEDWCSTGFCMGALKAANWLSDGFALDDLFKEANWFNDGFWTSGLAFDKFKAANWFRLTPFLAVDRLISYLGEYQQRMATTSKHKTIQKRVAVSSNDEAIMISAKNVIPGYVEVNGGSLAEVFDLTDAEADNSLSKAFSASKLLAKMASTAACSDIVSPILSRMRSKQEYSCACSSSPRGGILTGSLEESCLVIPTSDSCCKELQLVIWP